MSSPEDEIREDELSGDPSSSNEDAEMATPEFLEKDEEEMELERLVFGAPSAFTDGITQFSESDRRKRLGLEIEAAGDEEEDGLEELADDDVRF
jgi:hypothetical protein